MSNKKRVIALGFFDGVHNGHSALMQQTLRVSKVSALIPSVITFDAHPFSLISGKSVPLITSPEDRAGLIRRLHGIDDIILLHFDRNTANMPWADFLLHLVNDFGAQHLVAGSDFTFGRKGEGNSKLLLDRCGSLGVGCDIIPQIKRGGVTISSTYIRKQIAAGDIERANEFLGHPHVLTDVVRYGYRLGRTLGTPTINMSFRDGVLFPAFGVYVTKVFPDSGGEYTGVTNVGIRPTIDDGDERVTAETHILDLQENLYGHLVRIEFHARLREEIKFDGIDELKAQIKVDCARAREFFI